LPAGRLGLFAFTLRLAAVLWKSVTTLFAIIMLR
jgi:hypothetical protein